MNEQSSRSHCIVTVTVEKTCLDGSVLVGKLKMVDLAGRSADSVIVIKKPSCFVPFSMVQVSSSDSALLL